MQINVVVYSVPILSKVTKLSVYNDDCTQLSCPLEGGGSGEGSQMKGRQRGMMMIAPNSHAVSKEGVEGEVKGKNQIKGIYIRMMVIAPDYHAL